MKASTSLPPDFAAGETVRAAAVQFAPKIGDVGENLRLVEALVREAGEQGARLIMLPEFFTSGMAFDSRIRSSLQTADGDATAMLTNLAREYGAVIGGSFLCSGAEPRNAYMLVGPGGLLGRHDKDIPTMWEHCYYAGGDAGDDGLIDAGGANGGASGVDVGVAMCWELMRSQTAQRLRGKVDVVVAGSAWWSVPDGPLGWAMEPSRRRNARNAVNCVPTLARLVGAPVVHSALCGELSCHLLGTPFKYGGRFEGGAMICDADGRTLASRHASEGTGVVVADIELARREPQLPLPTGFWIHRRGVVAAAGWTIHGRLGKRWRSRQDRA